MNLSNLMTLLEETPVIADIHPVSCCYLPEHVWVTDSLAEVVWELDSPTSFLPKQILITCSDQTYSGRFPHVRVDHDPFTPDLNRILYQRFDDVASRMLKQSCIVDRILTDSQETDVVILYLVDGLSYARAKEVFSQPPCCSYLSHYSMEPCLVDAPTITSAAFPNLIGTPSLATRLFELGYHRRIGFSHWTRKNNTLTNRLFQSISPVIKVQEFTDLVQIVRKEIESDKRTFVQILRSGLDGFAHRQKRRPPIEAIVRDIWEEFMSLVDVCCKLRRSSRLYLTADHGILWRDEFEPEIVGRASPGSNPRCSTWRELKHQREVGRQFFVENKEMFCLNYPKVRRKLRTDEQGVHGGISYQESIVPFVSVHITP